MTRFPRRATILAAVLLAAPLGFTLTATAATAAPAAAQAVTTAGHAVAVADVAAAVSKKKKKKKKAAKKPATTKPATPVTTKPVESGSLESEVVALTNTYRTANGCGALRIDARLVTAARGHSTDMVTNNFFSHTGSNGSTFVQREAGAGYTTGASAENIAWGYRSPKEVVDGWINSAGHRANILNCASVAVGVGLAYKADGTPYWTQDFGRV
ncbi:CAP domain-containing protein [Dactylosporangium sp. NBC_01737]|uniref:CAP domain-containing protein n=1 Tax=Dactylosporangium sp. NBC_01737 TaxID=2975959 RepID=UPI002E147AFC|nr:CAP domain-containing protein [Dactylosporangium sp. NBC_01737]